MHRVVYFFAFSVFFFFNDTATTEIYTLSLHDALPISFADLALVRMGRLSVMPVSADQFKRILTRSEEHTSELQSRLHLVCRLLLEKKKKAAGNGAVLAAVRSPCPLFHLPNDAYR